MQQMAAQISFTAPRWASHDRPSPVRRAGGSIPSKQLSTQGGSNSLVRLPYRHITSTRRPTWRSSATTSGRTTTRTSRPSKTSDSKLLKSGQVALSEAKQCSSLMCLHQLLMRKKRTSSAVTVSDQRRHLTRWISRAQRTEIAPVVKLSSDQWLSDWSEMGASREPKLPRAARVYRSTVLQICMTTRFPIKHSQGIVWLSVTRRYPNSICRQSCLTATTSCRQLVQTLPNRLPARGQGKTAFQAPESPKKRQNAASGKKKPQPRVEATQSPDRSFPQQVAYFQGPQINQINLHVHFNESRNGPSGSPKGHTSPPQNLLDNRQAQIMKLMSQTGLERSSARALGVAGGSKETLNQSSSRLLPANPNTLIQSLTGQESPPFGGFNDRTLNNYSSMQTHHIASQSPQDQTRLDYNSKNDSHEPDKVSVVGAVNKGNGEVTSSDSSQSESAQGHQKEKVVVNQKQPNKDLQVVKQKSAQAQTARNAEKRRTPIDCSKLGKEDQQNETKMSDLTELSESRLLIPTQQQTQEVINQIINQLSQQQRSATIKITTHPKGSPQAATAALVMPKIALPEQTQRRGQAASSLMTLDKAKKGKMKRQKIRASTNEPRSIPQLHIYKHIAGKLGQLNSPFKQEHQSRDSQLYNTAHSGFGMGGGLALGVNQQHFRAATQTQANFNKTSSLASYDAAPGSPGLAPQRLPEMYRTIIQESSGKARWNTLGSEDQDQTCSERKPAKFNPFQTGFSTMSVEQADIASQLSQSAAFERSLRQTYHNSGTLSLKMNPEKQAKINGESTVLFKIPPGGQIGRFRPRKLRKKETFGERNSRLGHLATRTSIAKINKSVDVVIDREGAQASQMGAEQVEFSATGEGFTPKPEMLHTGNSIFSRRAMEQELNQWEQTEVSTPAVQVALPSSSAQEVSQQQAEQVIYEESVTEGHAENDDMQSHLSHKLSTFASNNATEMQIPMHLHTDSHDEVLFQDEIRGRNGKQLDQNQTQKSSDGSHMIQPSTAHFLQDVSSNQSKSRKPQPFQTTKTHHSPKKVATEKQLIDTIKQISTKKIPPGMHPNKSPIFKHQVYSANSSIMKSQNVAKSKVSAERAHKVDGLGSVTQRTLIANEPGIAKDEVLEGQSIYSIRQNNTWSMVRPPGQSGHNSPVSGSSPKASRQLNQNHIVVVQTPETIKVMQREDLKQRLDIKIRLSSQLLLPEVVKALSGQLDLTVQVIYYDGLQSLSSIQNGLGPKFVRQSVAFNAQGFAVNLDREGQAQTKWNLFDDMLHGQVKLEDLNFSKRAFLVEIELTEPNNREIYLLRYLTFNQMTQTNYPKIFISIMQHLSSKKRPLRIFDGMANEVLDLAREKTVVQNGMASLDALFEKLVVRETNYAVVMKTKPRLECPPIRMKGIVLESPKRKVQIKGLGEFISLTDVIFNRPKVLIPQNLDSQTLTAFRESGETLRPDVSDSQYVALPQTNIELPARFAAQLDHPINRSSLSKLNLTGSTSQLKSQDDKLGSSPVNKSPSRIAAHHGSPSRRAHNQSPTIQNYSSTSRIQLDPNQNVLNPCIQVKKITEQRPVRTPQRKIKRAKAPKQINKQQFTVDTNLEKGIDCSFEALGSSEGRHSANLSTPSHSPKRRVRRNRYSSSMGLGSANGSKAVHDEEVQAGRHSRHNLNFNSNTSEVEDEHHEAFGQTDRLQSIFTMQKKESDMQVQTRVHGGLLMIRGSKTDLVTFKHPPARDQSQKQVYQLSQSKEPRQRRTNSKQVRKDLANSSQVRKRLSATKSEKLGENGIEGSSAFGKINIQPLHGMEYPSSTPQDPSLGRKQTDSTAIRQFKDQVSMVNESQQSLEVGKSLPKKEPVAIHKSIVNILADEVIKEPIELGKHHRASNLSHMTKKTLTRRSNLRHALADEKSKMFLIQNESKASPLTMTNLQIQRKEIQQQSPQPAKPSKRPLGDSSAAAGQQAAAKDIESIESDIQSVHRDSLASHVVPAMSPTLSAIGSADPEVIIVRQKLKEAAKGGGGGSKIKIKATTKALIKMARSTLDAKKETISRTISFEKGGRQLDVQMFSEEAAINFQLDKGTNDQK